jgi:hypothetical protein
MSGAIVCLCALFVSRYSPSIYTPAWCSRGYYTRLMPGHCARSLPDCVIHMDYNDGFLWSLYCTWEDNKIHVPSLLPSSIHHVSTSHRLTLTRRGVLLRTYVISYPVITSTSHHWVRYVRLRGIELTLISVKCRPVKKATFLSRERHRSLTASCNHSVRELVKSACNMNVTTHDKTPLLT